MGRFDITKVRYITAEEWRILNGTEMGMKNHELVPMAMVAALANLKRSGAHKIIKDLSQTRLIAWEKAKQGKVYGYRLTWAGYDYLAFRALSQKGVVSSVGKQIGVGKESDVYLAMGRDLEAIERQRDLERVRRSENGEVTYGHANVPDDEEDMEFVKEVAIKIHRLGRTSFRQVKNKRDYHNGRNHSSWIYLSRLAATREYSFQKCLWERGFPVPKPLGVNRHMVIMELVRGYPLIRVDNLSGHELDVFQQCVEIVVNLAKNGIVHGDLNEFNLMVEDVDIEGKQLTVPKVIMIDFPQMIAIDHPQARDQFYRDVEGIRRYFELKFKLDLADVPDFDKIVEEQRILEEQGGAVEHVEGEDSVGVSSLAEKLENTKDVLSWKMNLMQEARKIGNDMQGGWAPMPKTTREDDANTGNFDSDSSDTEAAADSEDDLQNVPDTVVSEDFAKRMASIRTGMTEITGTTSVAPEVIKLRVKKAMELSQYRQKSSKLQKADKTSVKNRRGVQNDIRHTMAGGSRFDD